MTIRIAPDNGDIVTDHFRVGRTSCVSSLRCIDRDHFQLIGENGANRYFRVCRLHLPFMELDLVVFFEDDRVWCFSLEPIDTKEDWETWNEAREARKLRDLVRILTASGLRNPEDLPWGHVRAEIGARSGWTRLNVAYYPAKR